MAEATHEHQIAKGRVEYLGTDQSLILKTNYSVNSCTTVALHIAALLCYNDDDADTCKELIVRWIEFSSRCWLSRLNEHHGSYEHPSRAHERSRYPKLFIEPLRSHDIMGMSVKKRVAVARDFLTYGVKTALDKLAKLLVEEQLGVHSLACVFVSRGFSVAVVIKTDRARRSLRVDVVDSHRRNLLHYPPPPHLVTGSAIWGRFHCTEDAAAFIDAIFPPHDSDEELEKYSHVTQGKDETNKVDGEAAHAFRARSEQENIPGGYFDIHVFRPVQRTREEAERNASQSR